MPETHARHSDRIGRMLVGAGLVSEAQLRAALALQRRQGSKIGSALIEIGAIDEAVLGTFLGMQMGFDAVRLGSRRLPAPIVRLLSAETAWRCAAVPVAKRGSVVTVVFADPNDRSAIDAVAREIRSEIRPAVAPQTSILAALRTNYPQVEEARKHPRDTGASELVLLAKRVGELSRELAEVKRGLERLAGATPARPARGTTGRRSSGR